MIKNVNNQ